MFLVGAVAVALPFVYHLIRRSSREKFFFSSLMFLEPSPPRITKRSRLEHLLLLLFRCAVLSLFALAFARPFFPKAMLPATGAAQNRRVAILVDTSASMRREDLWDQAKARAAEVARSLRPGDALALYTFDQQLHPLFTFAEFAQMAPGDRTSAVQNRLTALSPTFYPTQLGRSMLRATEEILERLNSDAQEQGNSELRLVVVSDFQSGSHLDGLQGFEWPKRFQAELIPVTAKRLGNASVQVITALPNSFASSTNQPIRLRVTNARESKTEQLRLDWTIAGGSTASNLDTYVPAGQSRIVTLTAGSNQPTSIRLSGDEVDFDNTAYLGRSTVHPLTIGYVGVASPDDPAEMLYYLRRAFEQTNLTTHVVAISNTIPAADSLGMLVLGGALAPDLVAYCRALLDAGKTIVLPMREAADANLLSTLSGSLVTADEATVSNYALLSQIDFQHPLFAPFADARFSDFTKIHTWKFRNVNPAALPNARVLASFDSGAPAVIDVPAGKGRVLVLTTTWAPRDSQLALSSKFIPLLFGMLEQSANIRPAVHQYSVGETVNLPDGTSAVTLPDGSRRNVSGGVFTETSVPGLYTAGDFQFAVNLDPAESKLTPMTPQELSALGVPLRTQTDAAQEAAAEKRQRHLLATEAEARQKLWRNFLLATIAFVFLETFLSGRLSRRVAAA